MLNFSQRLLKAQIPVLLILVLVSGFMFASKYWKLDDDHLLMFLTGRAIFSGEVIESKLDELLTVLKSGEFQENGIERITVRKLVLRTYLLPSVIHAITSVAIDASALVPRQTDYGAFLIVSSILGYVLHFIVAASLAVLAILSADTRHRKEAVFTLGALMGALLFLDTGTLVLGKHWLDRILPAILNPGEVYGIFGMTARCNVVLIAFSIFILRGSDRYFLGYCAAVVAILFHRQQGALLFVILVSADLIMRPSFLAQPRIFFCIVLALSYFAGTETLWPQMGVSRAFGLSIVVGLGGLGLLTAVLHRRLGRGKEKEEVLERNTEGLMGLGRILRDDRSVFLLVFLFTLTVSLLAMSAGLGGDWSWRRLPGRVLILLQPLLVLSIVQLFHRLVPNVRVQGRFIRWSGHGIFVILALALCTVAAQGTNNLVDEGRQSARKVDWLEAMASLGVTPDVNYRDEAHIYYAILKSVDTGSDLFSQMIAGTRSPGFAAAIANENYDLFNRILERGEDLDAIAPMVAPTKWPRARVTMTPFMAAVLWERRPMAEALKERIGDDLKGASLATVCEAISRGISRKFREVAALADTADLNRPCPSTPGIEPRPPVCVLVNAAEFNLAQVLVEAGVSPAPPGGCDSKGRDVRAITLELKHRRPKNAQPLLRVLDEQEDSKGL